MIREQITLTSEIPLTSVPELAVHLLAAGVHLMVVVARQGLHAGRVPDDAGGAGVTGGANALPGSGADPTGRAARVWHALGAVRALPPGLAEAFRDGRGFVGAVTVLKIAA